MPIKDAYLEDLRRAWKDGNLVLFLGAGVTVPHGIPNWNNLVMELLLQEDSRFERFWPNYRAALLEWLSKTFDFTPVALSRVFKLRAHDEYLELVRTALYRKIEPPKPEQDTLQWVTDFIRKTNMTTRRPGVRAIVTSNFDDLLEQRLEPHVAVTPVHTATPQPQLNGTMRILHIHGFLPQHKPIVGHRIVFAEDEYNDLTYTMFHWAQVEMVSMLRNATVLFIGFSMNDQNIRRLLDATDFTDDDPTSVRHYAIKKKYEVKPEDVQFSVQEINWRAQKLAQSERDRKPDLAVQDAMGVAVKRARDYDDRMLARMGVGVLWIDDFPEIRDVLQRITEP